MKSGSPGYAALLALVLALAGLPAQPARALDDAIARASPAVDGPALERQLLVTIRSRDPRARSLAGYRKSAATSRSHADSSRRIAERVARDLELQLLDGWPMPSLGVECFVMQLQPGQSRPQVLAALAADARIESSEPMQEFHLLGAAREGSATVGKADPLLATQPAQQRWHLRELHGLATGRNVVVAQVDTGVFAAHPDLRGQVSEAKNFVPGEAFVPESHGTAVAGILAARANDGIGIAGVAPGAKLLALRACWQRAQGDARCSSYTLAQALQYALAERARVINLSVGGPRDALLGRLLDVALRSGVVVVAAVDARADEGGFPASHPGVLAVAAEGDRKVCKDALYAPGSGIPATAPNGGWDLVSGSSYAAAQVSGLVALLLELEPGLPATSLHSRLAPGGAPGVVDGTGLVDACAVLESATGRCSCSCGGARQASLRLNR